MKQAKHLNCDVNSQPFRDAMRYVWMPRLLERIRAPTPIHPNSSSIRPDSSGNMGLTQGSDSAQNGCSRVMGMTNQDQALYLEQGNSIINNLGFGGGDWLEGLWNDDNIWFLPQQLFQDL